MAPVTFQVERFIATMTLNRPEKLNAVTAEMSALIGGYADRVDADDDIRVMILSGVGDKAFCVGSDIQGLDEYSDPWTFRNRPDYCDMIRRVRKPVICAINGYALGGGLEAAMSCDIRIAAETASFAAPEIKLGWIGGGGMSFFLSHSIGASNAAWMLLTGDAIPADKALTWGLVSETVPREQLAARALALAATIAQQPPIAAQTAKANLRALSGMSMETAIQYERDLQTICFGTRDAEEGRAAFKTKRRPAFRGR